MQVHARAECSKDQKLAFLANLPGIRVTSSLAENDWRVIYAVQMVHTLHLLLHTTTYTENTEAETQAKENT